MKKGSKKQPPSSRRRIIQGQEVFLFIKLQLALHWEDNTGKTDEEFGGGGS
jgi:hypothetical protein